MPRRLACAVLWTLALATFSVATGASPSVDSAQFVPLIVPIDRADPVLYEARVSGSPTRVVLVLNAASGATSERALRDDGTGGDHLRGDGIYTVTLSVREITSLLRPDDVLRAEVGFLDVYAGALRATRLNVFADVLTPEVPRLPVTPLAADAQRTDYLVNLVVSGFVLAEGFDIEAVTRRFYELFPDEFAFLNLISVPASFRNRFHFGVKSEARGIGIQPFDETGRYGSAGRLLGITVFPIPGMFDGAEPAYLHELGHQWINFLPLAPLNYAIPHWPLSDLASGIMGFSEEGYGQGLEFPCVVTPVSGGATLAQRVDPAVFTDLDLYLMGLLPAGEVGTHYVFPRGTHGQDLFPLCDGETWRGRLETVTIQDIVRRLGPRVPDAEHSAHRFRIATVIVSRDGLLSEEAMAFYSHFAQRAEATEETLYHSGFAKGSSKPFALAARGLGSLDTRLVTATGGMSPVLETVFDGIGLGEILTRAGGLSAVPISGSDVGNLLPVGTVVLYRTNEGRLGKLQVIGEGRDLTVRFVTYNADGSISAAGDSLLVPGTFLADLDAGTMTYDGADFLWGQWTETVRYLEPWGGALFGVWPPS